MATMATTDGVTTPDPTKASVPERSRWLLARLREQPGVTEGSVRRLDLKGGLAPLLCELLTGLTKDQAHATTKWLRENGYWDVKARAHYIRMDDEPLGDPEPASPPAAVDVQVEPEALEAAAALMTLAAHRIRTQRDEIARLRKGDATPCVPYNGPLAVVFYNGLNNLSCALDGA